MEATIQEAVDQGQIPGVVLLSANVSGSLNYKKAIGFKSMEPFGQSKVREPMTTDTAFRIWSASKLTTSVCALKCVELGLLTLDEPVERHRPDLGQFKVITGFDDKGEPVLRDPKRKITMRHLLTHSSGIAWDAGHPLLEQYRKWQNVEVMPQRETIAERFTYPLIYDPGEGWSYGPGVDWAGMVIVAAAKASSLDEFMQEHVAKKLGIKDVTFKPTTRPDLVERRAMMTFRDGDTGKLEDKDEINWHQPWTDDLGGQGISASPEQYFEVLKSILVDDERLLKKNTSKLLFEPQLTGAAEKALNKIYKIEIMNQFMGALLPMGCNKNHGLGGLLITEDLDGNKWRSKNTLIWSGLPNVFWCIDREAGICCLYTTQIQPPGDLKSIELGRLFERDMYRRLRELEKPRARA